MKRRTIDTRKAGGIIDHRDRALALATARALVEKYGVTYTHAFRDAEDNWCVRWGFRVEDGER